MTDFRKQDAPDPQPQLQPVGASQPDPVPQPVAPSQPASIPQSQPAGASQSDPVPQPAASSQPASIPQPQPAASSQLASAPQPQPQSQPAEPARHHVHHSYIWLGSIQVALAILVVMVISVFSSFVGALADGAVAMGRDVPALMIAIALGVGGFVLLVGLVALVQWWSYRHLYYELGPEEFNLYSGIFNKRRVHIPYQRIQSVDQRATLTQRVFGVCTVSIDTAGGSANKAVSVPYVQKAQAEELRRELFARKRYAVAVQEGADPALAARMASPVGAPNGGAPGAGNVLDAPAEIWEDVRGVFGGAHVDTGRVTFEYGLSNKELVLTGLSNHTAFLVIVLGVVGAVAQFASQMLPLFKGAASPTVDNVVAQSVSLFGGNMIALGVAAFLVGSLVMWIMSAVGACISFGGFKARRRDSRIEVERGLLQHQFQGVDISRVQSVVVKQSFIRRILGYCEVSLGKIDAAVEGADEQEKSLTPTGIVIHPFVKLSRVPEILAGMVPEFADVPVESTPVAPVALRRALIRRGIWQGTGFWLAVVIAATQLAANLFASAVDPDEAVAIAFVNAGAPVGYALCLVFLAFDIVGAVLWFRGSGFAYNARFMQVSNGGLARETVSFPRKKMQFGYTRSNPFQRRANTVTINARTAAGIGGTTVRLIDARAEDAQAWLDWVKPKGNVIE